MNKKNDLKFFVLVVVLLVFSPAWAQQASLFQPSEKTINAITTGDWNLVRAESISWISRDSHSELALFLADVATSVTRDYEKNFKTLMKYDYPYSDQEARNRLKTWIDSLLKMNDRNANYLILNASLQIKGYGNMTKATKIFEQARKYSPDNEFVLINLGNSYGSTNRTKEAKELFDNVLKKNPISAGALNGLGMVAMSRKDMSKALNIYEKAVKVNGAGPIEWFNLGSLYYFQKRFQEARQALEKAIELSPKMIDARFNLAGSYYSLGRKSDCIEQLKKIVDIDPTSTTGKRASKNLGALGR